MILFLISYLAPSLLLDIVATLRAGFGFSIACMMDGNKDIIALTEGLISRYNVLIYPNDALIEGAHHPFEWFSLPIAEKLSPEDIAFIESYGFRIALDRISRTQISYYVYGGHPV